MLPKITQHPPPSNFHDEVPRFFIIGAPKCGTTSLYHYLRAHPDIYMPYDEKNFWMAKEPHHLADDLGMKPNVRIEQESQYSALFDDRTTESSIGEASALYLYSESAAARIKDRFPNAKIIIMLRPPLDLMRSWHQDCLRFGHDDIVDFREAIEAERERSAGNRIPAFCSYPSRLIYTEMGAYVKHVERYLRIFNPANVKIVLLEEMEHDPARVYDDLLEFLGVGRSFSPAFRIHHESVRSDGADVQGMKLKLMAVRYASGIFKLFQSLSPEMQKQIRLAYRHLCQRLLPQRHRPELDPMFLDVLRSRYDSDVVRLGNLLDRDLTHWLSPVSSMAIQERELNKV